MPSTLSELCKHMQNCTDQLEEEIKNNINACNKLLLSNQATETKLALERAKDYHYKEILDFLREIVTNIRKIIFHERKIRTLSDETNFTPEELKRYSYVQRQVKAFSNTDEEVVTKREKRRVASEVSLESLDAWEAYLEKKQGEEQKVIQEDKSEIPKRKRMNNRRRKKKFVSSTFNNFLDKSGERRLDSILEGSATEEDFNLDDRLVLEENKTDSSNESILESTEELGIEGNSDSVNDQDQCVSFEEQLEHNSTCASSSGDESSDQEEQSTLGGEEIKDKYSLLNIVECINQKHFLEDSNRLKPKIVDVVYKKKGN